MTNPPSPETALILSLRATSTPWTTIASTLHTTPSAAYSRSLLAGTTSATPVREIGFSPADYAHLRAAGTRDTSKAGRKRVKDFQHATELSANVRVPVRTGTSPPSTSTKITKQTRQRPDKTQTQTNAVAKRKGRGKDEERRKGGDAEGAVVHLDDKLVEVVRRAMGRVERNFWVFVADEVEREAGVYFEAGELERIVSGSEGRGGE